MNLNQFINIPVINKYANEKIWTVSDQNKKPLDFNALLKGQIYGNILPGATFENGNQPLVTLYDILNSGWNFTNVTMLLNQAAYKLCVLDIEPECPDNLKQELTSLPCSYMETSMSGKGVHMIFENMQTDYPQILASKQVLKMDKLYEFLLNRHYVTFTGNMLINNPTRPVEDIKTEFDKLASKATVMKVTELDTSDLPNISNIHASNKILGRLVNEIQYNKTPDDFKDYKNGGKPDISRWEYGYMGFIYIRLVNILCAAPYNTQKYSKQEQLVLLYEASRLIIPYREKHDTYRQGLPYLMYVAKKMVTTEKEE